MTMHTKGLIGAWETPTGVHYCGDSDHDYSDNDEDTG